MGLIDAAVDAAEKRQREREAEREARARELAERQAAERERIFGPIEEYLTRVLGPATWVVERVGSADGDSPWVVVHPMEAPDLKLIARVGTICIAERSLTSLPLWGRPIESLADLGDVLIDQRQREHFAPSTDDDEGVDEPSGLTSGGSCRG